jgi:very-short-patch-repair endonuclease
MTLIKANDFRKALENGDLKPCKKGRHSFKARSGFAIGLIMEQESAKEKKALKSIKKPKIPRKEAKQLTQMKLWLYAIYGQHIEYEYKFAQNRRFRADIAIPEAKILIEYEGLNSEKSGHTTLMGYSKDTEKYNLASTLGFKVIRYTVMNYQNVISDVELLLKELNVTLRNTPDHGQEREH